jgi:DNA modification methylase
LIVGKLAPQKIETVPIGTLKHHPKNPRKGDVKSITESIEHNGFYGVVVAQKSTGYVLAGNHRMMAAKAAGLDSLPVAYVDVDDSTALKILLADNRTNDLATYDNKELAELLADVSNKFGLDGTGYDEAFLDSLIGELGGGGDGAAEGEAPEAQLDKAEELREKWGVEFGQLWEVGRHRILCGDSAKKEDVERLMGGKKAVLMVTDPPYGVEAVGGTRDPRDTKNFKSGNAIKNDELTGDKLKVFLEKVFREWTPFLNPGAAWYCFYADTETIPVLHSLELLGGARHILVWVKEQFVFGRCDYHYKHEPVAYGWMPGAGHTWLGSHDQSTVWDIARDNVTKKLHPTVKPVDVFTKPYANHTVSGDLVIEPFVGSGSQMCAAEMSNRICFGMEIEPKYVAVTLERLSEMGLEPKLVIT